MKEQLNITRTFRIITAGLIIIGAMSFILGIISDSQRTWASYLISNYYFFSLAIGGAFFLALQSISQSGWSAAFKHVPEGMMAYIPFSAVSFLLLYFGLNDLYHWSHTEALETDPLIQHKSAFLNVPFFYLRMIIYFALWIFFVYKLRKLSSSEDNLNPASQENIMNIFGKSEFYSKCFIFVLAITFSLSAFDWIMSIESHWYSTIFALKNLVAAFLHGVSIFILIIFILYKRGYFPFLNEYHVHDFSRYIFMLSIVWGYFWFAQFMIIWYGNIPEETVYYDMRWEGGWEILFFVEIGLNWALPFFVLLPVKTSRNVTVLTLVIIVLIIGQYVDLFVQVIPGTTGHLAFGWIEAGIFLGYAGLFALVVATAISKVKLIPANHPYLEESLNHKFS